MKNALSAKRTASRRNIAASVSSPPAQPQHVVEHATRVPHHRHLRVRCVSPHYRYLADLTAAVACGHQDLDVEREAVDALLREQRASQLTTEELEAALCVAPRNVEHALDDLVEGPPH